MHFFYFVENFLFKMFQAARSSCGRGSMTVRAMRLRYERNSFWLLSWSGIIKFERRLSDRYVASRMCRWWLDKARLVILLQRQLSYVISGVGVVSAQSLMPSVHRSVDRSGDFLTQWCSIPTIMEPSGPSPAPSFSTAVCYFSSSCGGIQFRFQSYLNDIFYFSQSKLTL